MSRRTNRRRRQKQLEAIWEQNRKHKAESIRRSQRIFALHVEDYAREREYQAIVCD